MNQYSIGISIHDATSVDASSIEEAKQLALEIFKENGYDVDQPHELYVNQIDKLYVIEADYPMSSWEGRFTEEELIDKFWDYALQDELYDSDYWYQQYFNNSSEDSKLTKKNWLKQVWTIEPPEWFNLSEIQEVWQIDIKEASQDDEVEDEKDSHSI